MIIGIQNLAKLTSNPSIKGISPSSTLVLLSRGGAAAAQDVVLKNYYNDALGFFGGIRIPASFLAGSSLAAIFLLKNAGTALASGNDASCNFSSLERRVVKFYHLTSLLAFVLSLQTTAIATMAHTSVLHGKFDQLAESAYLLLKREFEMEFVVCRWSFITSLLCFLGMVTSRLLIEFELLKVDSNSQSGRRDAAMLVVCSMGSLSASLLSYVNQHLWCWQSMIGMTVHLAKMCWKKAFVDIQPLQIVSMLCTLASVFYVGKLAIEDLPRD
ncbi:hypothetical protein HJC23_013747 [Cyclotella cryptica]|uniref:Uncharacterized protein n=1 Tax=Cyclotella cryptica TaxID=29204 RepID=A0ABD3PHJ0_9STRA